MLNQLNHYFTILEKSLAALSLLLLLLFALIQVIARNFFETGFPVLEVISRHLVLYVTFLGAALITTDHKHIKIDFLQHFLSVRQKQWLVRPLSLLAALVCAAFAWHAARFWLDEWQYASTQDEWIVILASILPVGFCIIGLHFFVQVINPKLDAERQQA